MASTIRERRERRGMIREIIKEFPKGHQFTAADICKILKERHGLEMQGVVVGTYISGLEERFVVRVKAIHTSDNDYHIWKRI